MAPDQVEAVVVGSGFGGAVVACRLAQAGLRVLILERGRRYEAGDFPPLPPESALLPDLRRLTWSPEQGLFDVVDLGEMVSVQAAGYGGGSLIYANVHLRPPAAVFDQRWPEVYRNRSELDPYFDLAAYMLGVSPVTAHPEFQRTLTKSAELERVARELGRGAAFFHPPIAVHLQGGQNVHGVVQKPCTGCGRCCVGCPETAKNTLDFNYLALAERFGARVLTECEVLDIERSGEHWQVSCMNHLVAEKPPPIRTRYVFLCAGSIHSTRLLARAKLGPVSKQVHSLVGIGYFPGGDAIGVVYDSTTPQEPSRGPTITASLVQRTGQERGDFFLIQDGGYPAELARLLGVLRAPAWVGRNRLTLAANAVLPPEDSEPEPAFDPRRVELVSAFDEVLDALSSGAFGAIASPEVAKAFDALRDELVEPVLLPAVVERTIDAAIRARFKRWAFTRRWRPDKFPLKQLMRIEKCFIGWWFGTDRALGSHAMRAVLGDKGLSRAEVAKRVLGYTGRGTEQRAMLLAMGRDAAAGHLRYDRHHDRLIADLELFRLAPGYSSEERLMADIAGKLGGELRTNPAWAFLGKPITVHNQGGCRMSDSPNAGVTTPEGLVHGCEGLYVLDGASLCTSVGVNPSATIAALAERNALRFIRTHTQHARWPEGDGGPGARLYESQQQGARDWAERAAREGWAIEPPDVISAQPQSPALGLSFREVMQGYYAPGVEPPADDAAYRSAETRGRPEFPVELALSVSTPNLGVFFEDPYHRMQISGRVQLRLPMQSASSEHEVQGELELFVAPDKPYAIRDDELRRAAAQRAAVGSDPLRRGPRQRGSRERLMVYRLSFDEGGRVWFLNGYKRIRDDPGVDAWRDTSALFVKLWSPAAGLDGSDPALGSELAGAGVVHVDVNGFLFRQLRSMQVTPNTDPARVAWAIATFASFFFGALQRVYLPELGGALQTLFSFRAPGAGRAGGARDSSEPEPAP